MTNIVITRKYLEQKLKKHYDRASPYTGEYHMGIADFINELLGQVPIDWEKHPSSLNNMIRLGIIKHNIQSLASKVKVEEDAN